MDKTPAKFMEQQIQISKDKTNIGPDFWASVEKLMKKCKLKARSSGKQAEELKKSLRVSLDLVRGQLSKLRLSGPPILFFFDEARSLLDVHSGTETSLFRIFRRCLKCFPAAPDPSLGFVTTNVFSIFLDTYSKVANFSPVDRANSSLRETNPLTKLYSPIWLLDVFDTFSKKHEPSSYSYFELIEKRQVCVDLLQANMEAFQSSLLELQKMTKSFLITQFRKGRPLWFTTLEVNSFNIRALVKFAKIKLLCKLPDKNGVFISTELKEAEALAVMDCRMCLTVDSFSRSASDMVTSHMAECIGITSDREQIHTAYPPEPILAGIYLLNTFPENFVIILEAAAQLLRNRHTEYLRHLNTLIKTGIVDAGFRGELVARFLLLEAWERASLKVILITTGFMNLLVLAI